jgi:hypothetical protein
MDRGGSLRDDRIFPLNRDKGCFDQTESLCGNKEN